MRYDYMNTQQPTQPTQPTQESHPATSTSFPWTDAHAVSRHLGCTLADVKRLCQDGILDTVKFTEVNGPRREWISLESINRAVANKFEKPRSTSGQLPPRALVLDAYEAAHLLRMDIDTVQIHLLSGIVYFALPAPNGPIVRFFRPKVSEAQHRQQQIDVANFERNRNPV